MGKASSRQGKYLQTSQSKCEGLKPKSPPRAELPSSDRVVCGLKFKMQVLNPAITLWDVWGPWGCSASQSSITPCRMEMGLNPGTPRHGRECGARPLNGRIIEDELGVCQLGSLGLIWFNFVLMFLSPVVLWHSRRGGSGAAASVLENWWSWLSFGQSSLER